MIIIIKHNHSHGFVRTPTTGFRHGSVSISEVPIFIRVVPNTNHAGYDSDGLNATGRSLLSQYKNSISEPIVQGQWFTQVVAEVVDIQKPQSRY